MHSKVSIFNLALGALLLQQRITNTDTDKSAACAVLNTHWDTAWGSTLESLDLDSTSTPVTLELIAQNPTDRWLFSYKYPINCAFFRRIESSAIMDNRTTFIEKRIAILGGKKVVLTNQELATAEIIATDVPVSSLSMSAGYAVALRLASMAAPLIVGKGATTLMKAIEAKYMLIKAEAQELDRKENFIFPDPDVESEFVEARRS